MCHAGIMPSVLFAVPFEWPTFLHRLGSDPPEVFTELATATGSRNSDSAATHSVQAAAMTAPAAAHSHASPKETAERVAAAVAGVLGSAIGPHEPLMAAGLDSLGAVELRNTLESVSGLQLPGT